MVMPVLQQPAREEMHRWQDANAEKRARDGCCGERCFRLETGNCFATGMWCPEIKRTDQEQRS